MKYKKSISELIDEYESNSSYKLHNFLLISKHIQYVFEDNFKELLNHITKYEKETVSRGKKFKEKKLTRIKNRNYLKKFIKYFHNYVAAVYSAEEHYNKFLPMKRSVWEKFKTIKQEPLHLFIFALRNNITHYTIPPISISVIHKKRMTSQGEVLFLTKGQFRVNKAAILSDHQNAQPTRRRGQSNSKFLSNDSKRNILYRYILEKYRGTSSIDLKRVIKNHRILFLKYIRKADSELVESDKIQYSEIKKLYQEIIKRQSLL